MLLLKIIAPLAALACVNSAAAQTSTSTTTNMGAGMTHTDTMGSDGSTSSTNCMDIAGGMQSCNTMQMGQPVTPGSAPDMSRPQTNGSTLSYIGSLIAASNERSFQKKIGKMLDSGECNGAAKYAYSKGRAELGLSIADFCNSAVQQTSSQAEMSIDPSQLQRMIQEAALAVNAKAPYTAPASMALDQTTTISKVEAIGTQILLSAYVDTSDINLTDEARVGVVNKLCADPSSPPILRAGGSIRIKYVQMSGKDIGSVMVTRNECGL